jgi:ATP-binding protein involved in chromosome partitioning
MMNLTTNLPPELNDKDLMIPLKNYNVSCMSMGFLVDENAPIVWRGLMAMQAIERLLFKVDWSGLDILVIDLPPGTGDIQLSICQNLNINSSIIVSTPQTVALIDVRRMIEMFKKMNINISGIVQNMSRYKCKSCGNVDYIFGKGGARLMGDELKIQTIADLPIESNIRETSDCGKPMAVNSFLNDEISDIYGKICQQILNDLKIN